MWENSVVLENHPDIAFAGSAVAIFPFSSGLRRSLYPSMFMPLVKSGLTIKTLPSSV